MNYLSRINPTGADCKAFSFIFAFHLFIICCANWFAAIGKYPMKKYAEPAFEE